MHVRRILPKRHATVGTRTISHHQQQRSFCSNPTHLQFVQQDNDGVDSSIVNRGGVYPTFNSFVKLVSPYKNRVYLRYLTQHTLASNPQLHLMEGTIDLATVLQTPFGSVIHTVISGKQTVPNTFLVLRATLDDIIRHGKRFGQVIYGKDAAVLVHKLNVGSGSRVLEAGCGSAHFTQVLAWRVGESGRVYSFEKIAASAKLARQNLIQTGLINHVDLITEELSASTITKYEKTLTDLDAVFLDMKDPIPIVNQVHKLLKPGAMLALLVPTTNQLTDILKELESERKYGCVTVEEIMVREYKCNADRIRPLDTMIAHTAYLLFCTALHSDAVAHFQKLCAEKDDGQVEFDSFFAQKASRRSARAKKYQKKDEEEEEACNLDEESEGDNQENLRTEQC